MASSAGARQDEGSQPDASNFGSIAPRIVNGTLTADHPAVGALLSLQDPANPVNSFSGTRCSGTLIGCQTFLTAAHCVCDTTGPNCQPGGGGLGFAPSQLLVFLQNGGIFAVSSIAVNPDYTFEVGGDVAVLELTSPVTGIAPDTINTIGKPAPGTAGTIVGFGTSGGANANNDSGLKRVGKVTTTACTGVREDTHVCWLFTNPIGDPGVDSNTCSGDSGGPLFVDLGSGESVAGVTSGGSSNDCLPDDFSFDADVFDNRQWIENAAGTDLASSSCGALPEVGGPGTATFADSGEIMAAAPEAVHSFEVATGTTLLRVALNGDETGGADFDLSIKSGSPATTSDFDCRSARNSQFDFCEVFEPAAGTWFVRVSRFSGAGQYQLTATMFSTDEALPTPSPSPVVATPTATATPVPASVTQTNQQQGCINTLNRDGARVAAKQAKENISCMKVSDTQACLTSDTKGTVQRAASKTTANEQRKCATRPAFGFAGADAINEAAVNESVELMTDVFGTDLNGAIVDCTADPDGCRCQSTVVKRFSKIIAAKLREFRNCKKQALKEGAGSAAALEACVTPSGIAADGKGKVAKAIAKLGSDIEKKCSGNVFPGLCSGEPLTSLSTCIDQRVECRVCRMINAMDDLAVDCDRFDDGQANGSCATTGAPEPTPLPAGQLSCNQMVNGELRPTDPDLFSDGTLADVYTFAVAVPTTVTFSLATASFEPFLWVGSLESVLPLLSGTSPQAGVLPAGVYNIIANNFSPLPPGIYPYELTISCTN